MSRSQLAEDALAYHQFPRPGKLGITITKPTEAWASSACAKVVSRKPKLISEPPCA